MALSKSSTTEFGTSAAYWKITSLSYLPADALGAIPGLSEEIDTDDPAAQFEVSLYLDKDSSDAGKKPFCRMRMWINVDLESSSNFVVQAYAYLKTLDEFDGATDV
jgi:hypothetical protein